MRRGLRSLSVIVHRGLLLEDGDPHPGWAFEEMQTELLQLEDHWRAVRGIMRSDLGVDPGPAGS